MKKQHKNRVLFLDLDSTIIETKSGETFPKDVNDWKFKKGILKAIAKKVSNIDIICIVTNQGGIDEGYYTPLDISQKVQIIIENIKHYINLYYSSVEYLNIDFAKPIICVGKKENRKPLVAEDLKLHTFEDMDFENSLMVGDASGLWRRIPGTPKEITKQFSLNKDNYLIELENVKYEKVTLPQGAVNFYTWKKDFSDSDKKFAELLGVKYIDVVEFIKNYNDKAI